MKIAIIAPSPVPYTIGGAEKFWWGLHQAINQYSTHQAELIKLPAPENCFIDLMGSYEKFCKMDLSHFDMVISSKYPAWMIEHPNHHCYMVHRLRGVYDTYHFTGQPIEIEFHEPELDRLLDIIDSSRFERNELDSFWQEWHRLKELMDSGQLSEQLFSFPGPISRKIIHFLDNIALSSKAIQRFSAISYNLVTRKDYFPANAQVEVIHPPSDIEGFKSEVKTERPAIFTMSRLDGPKRIEMLVRAFMQTTVDVDFRIAGTGPEEENLKKLAATDHRIKFIGRITDQQAIDEYAAALFVPFIPYDEDYGLITIEAMKSHKAVLTTQDAGGVNEFVENNVSGFSVEATPEALAAAMTKMVEDSHHTQKMGENALQKVAHVNWKQVVHQLLNPENMELNRNELVSKLPKPIDGVSQRKNIVVVLTFSVYPPRGGGQSRAYNIYREVAREHNVTLVVLLDQEKTKKSQKQNIQYQEWLVAPNMREIRVSKSQEHLNYEHELHKQLGTPVEDIACIEGYALSPSFTEILNEVCQEADLVINCHPFLYYAIREVWDGPLWYEAQDVEVDIKKDILGDQEAAKEWIEKTARIEQNCSIYADRIFTCSQKDADRICNIYAQPPEKLMVIANGVDMRVHEAYTSEQKEIFKQLSSFDADRDNLLVLFMGSWHGPNIEAVEQIKNIAGQCSNSTFLIMGSVCGHASCQNLPENIIPLGLVSESEKNLYLHLVDLAVNPMLSGSGTNLKMLDYTANRLPVLTTPFGLRGLTFIPNEEVISSEIEQFEENIKRLLNMPILERKSYLKDMADLAYDRTQKEFSWQFIAGQLLQEI